MQAQRLQPLRVVRDPKHRAPVSPVYTDYGPLKNDCGKLVLDDTEKAERLNNYFMSVFTADDGSLPDFGRRVDESVFINHVEFTSLDLIKVNLI